MTLLQAVLHLTNFKNPLLRTLVPTISTVFAIQAAFGIPSIIAQDDRFYDFSGSLTFLSATALSLYLPSLRARYASSSAGAPVTGTIPSLLSPFLNSGGVAGMNWRQVVLSGAVVFWAARLGSYLFQRVLSEGKDSRFDEIKKSPTKFGVAFFAQATWVSLCLLPIIAVNAVPSAAFAAMPAVVSTDIVGLSVFVAGFAFEIAADRQKSKWLKERRRKLHDEQFMTRGLWSRSQYPNYFGEISLWTGLAITAGGLLAAKPLQLALGLSGGFVGSLQAMAIASVSPAFVSLLLLKVSGVPLSEKKYDGKYGDRKDYQEWKKNTPKIIPRLF